MGILSLDISLDISLENNEYSEGDNWGMNPTKRKMKSNNESHNKVLDVLTKYAEAIQSPWGGLPKLDSVFVFPGRFVF